MTTPPAHGTRLERILGVPLADDAMRQWPQSGEVINGRQRIGEVESHFEGLRLAVGRRHACGDTLVVEWSTDYGDGRVYRNVTVADLRDGHAIRVTDYWGEPFEAPAWRESLADALDMPPRGLAGSRSPSRRRRIALSVPSARVVEVAHPCVVASVSQVELRRPEWTAAGLRDALPFRKSRIATLRAPCSRPSLAGECESDGFGAPRCRELIPG